MKVIYVDIDETICRREKSTDFGVVHDYKKAKPIKENIEKINKKLISYMMRDIQSYTGQQEGVENKSIGLN